MKSCPSCEYAEHIYDMNYLKAMKYKCRCKPPIPSLILVPGINGAQMTNVTNWPIVLSNDWCGAWSAKTSEASV